jgi:hypothetical protein
MQTLYFEGEITHVYNSGNYVICSFQTLKFKFETGQIHEIFYEVDLLLEFEREYFGVLFESNMLLYHSKVFSCIFVTHQMKYLSPYWSRRLKSALTVPLTAMSCFAIFTFFAGNKIGYIVFYRLILEGELRSLPVCSCKIEFDSSNIFMS